MSSQSASDVQWFAAPDDDFRADCAFRAWGSRRVLVEKARPGSAGPFHQPGVVTAKSLRTVPRLPRTAEDVDSVYREPQRACGGWTMIRPFHQQYSYYKAYGNAGCHALSSHHHNFPIGDVPAPQRVYSEEAQSRVTKVRNTRPKVYRSSSTNTIKTVCSPLFTNGRGDSAHIASHAATYAPSSTT